MLNIVFRNVNMLHSWVTGFFFQFLYLKKKALNSNVNSYGETKKTFFLYLYPCLNFSYIDHKQRVSEREIWL